MTDKLFWAAALMSVAAVADIEPGKIWPDDKGAHINAHGGGVLEENGVWWWYGEDKIAGKAGNNAYTGVHVYSSKDLLNWTDRGLALDVRNDAEGDLAGVPAKVERPKVLRSLKTGRYVMYFHLVRKGEDYYNSRTGIAVADAPQGPFRFVKSVRPNPGKWPLNAKPEDRTEEAVKKWSAYSDWTMPDWSEKTLDFIRNGNIVAAHFKKGQLAQDQTLFRDDDGKTYHVYASEFDATIHIAELTEDLLNHTGRYWRILAGTWTEAPALCRRGGWYYLLGSGCSGWAPNAARNYRAKSLSGPWESLGNPCKGVNPQNGLGPEKTWGCQSTFLLPYPGRRGEFIALFDMWRPENAVDGRYVWLPVEFTAEGRMRITWRDSWRLSEKPCEGDEKDFVPLFNGKDLSGWIGNTDVYWIPEGGILQCGGREGVTPTPDDALMTEKSYADFVIRFDFRTWKGGDNGFGFRYPGVDDMAYSGIEMQLADTVRGGKGPDAWRAMGGFYGVSNALDDRRPPGQPLFGATYIKPLGEWNACELRAEGPRVTAWINGVKVNEVDLSTKDPDTGYDNHAHSGVRSRKGHFIWWVGNPKVPAQWRNIRVKELKSAAETDPGKRRFLYSDFMNRKLVYVDEANPSAYWETFLPEVAFDITRCGLNRLVAAQKNGCRLYDLGQMRFLSEIKDPGHVTYATSATRFPDGRTFILDGAAVHEYDKDGKWMFAYTLGDKQTRVLRFTDRGTALIGAYTGFAEVVLDRDLPPEKRLLKWFALPAGARYAYQAEYGTDGSLLTTGGYLAEAVRFSGDGKILDRRAAPQPEGFSNYFYGGFHVRPNGNFTVANWTGHSGRDFRPGWKLIEFTPAGAVAWTWNAPWAGTPDAVIVFD
jgi:hypothetical protein